MIIPAYNEATRLPATLDAIATYFSDRPERPRGVGTARTPQGSRDRPGSVEVIVVDDGSTDGTVSIVESLPQSSRVPIRLARLPQNRGKGAAVRAGVLAGAGEWLLIMDADNATPITELPRLWSQRLEAPIVLGSRYLAGSDVRRAQPLARRIISRGGNALIRLLLGLELTDTQNGFKLLEGKAARAIFTGATIDRWGFDIELLALARQRGLRILEVPVAWTDAAGSKLRAGRDAWNTLHELLKIRSNLHRKT